MESANDMILGMSATTARIIIPSLITILVFFFSQVVIKISSKTQRKKELESIKFTIEQRLIHTEEPLQYYIDGLIQFKNALNKTQYLDPEVLRLNKVHIDKLQEFRLNELTNTLILNIKGKREINAYYVSKLIESIGYISMSYPELRKSYEDYQTRVENYMKEWNALYNDLFKKLNNAEFNIKRNPNNEEFITKINQITYKFAVDNKQRPVQIIFNELIDPVFVLSIDFLKNNNEGYVKEIVFTIEQLELIKYQWQKYNKRQANYIGLYTSRLEQIQEKLKTIKKHLSATELKWWGVIK
ncbi:MAG: hypothetical protein ACEPOV_06265 [Hyphomicrobiales bacterium]